MIRMLHNKILVEQFDVEQETASGIVVTTKKEGQQRGRVVAAGPGTYDEKGNFIETNVEEGDIVVFSDKAKSKITLEGKEYMVLFEPEIYGIIKET